MATKKTSKDTAESKAIALTKDEAEAFNLPFIGYLEAKATQTRAIEDAGVAHTKAVVKVAGEVKTAAKALAKNIDRLKGADVRTVVDAVKASDAYSDGQLPALKGSVRQLSDLYTIIEWSTQAKLNYFLKATALGTKTPSPTDYAAQLRYDNTANGNITNSSRRTQRFDEHTIDPVTNLAVKPPSPAKTAVARAAATATTKDATPKTTDVEALKVVAKEALAKAIAAGFTPSDYDDDGLEVIRQALNARHEINAAAADVAAPAEIYAEEVDLDAFLDA